MPQSEASSKITITVFGGTGFLGHRICEKLLRGGVDVRIAARKPHEFQVPQDAIGKVAEVETNIRDANDVASAIDGADGVVNAVSLYVERGDLTFKEIHVDGAARVAEAARKHGCRRLVHLSGIGSDAGSSSPYVRSRAGGEKAVRDSFPDATMFRPSVMFGEDDSFLNRLIGLARWFPVLPLVGNGKTKLQPAAADNVAEAACAVLTAAEEPASVYEFGGPEILTYRELLEKVVASSGRRRFLLPVPKPVWDGLAMACRILPEPPLTEGQVALLKKDNVASKKCPGFSDLGVRPIPVADVLAGISNRNAQSV